ncbi:hypothetical protein DPMN_060629 [Dreissena polymorpha]|uniref:Uncharacterized protein n=1 Tax=Dreissena polymorpha TaxID=45954 RepID=A0A9D4C5J9_DREPO|nr:hypothetical protein DPMN_060629 [Dreissena polymorpha]
MGMFGGIQVTWSLSPGDDIDLRPSSGFVTFTSDQDIAYITLESVPDEVMVSHCCILCYRFPIRKFVAFCGTGIIFYMAICLNV